MSDMSQIRRDEEDDSEVETRETDGWELSDDAREQVELLESPEIVTDE